ncbi:hypothetical protein VTK73DRAFT_8143 [Phialemonium thermophilum]|uniref:Uncharacterized protein n=1 Tax=Phialemonium thermophilum TaxID=223376 RepID=A0ABR3WAE0_9PEZI
MSHIDRYAIPNDAKVLLRAHDDCRFGRIKHHELVRVVQLSTNARKVLTEAIKKCARIIATKPWELNYCVDIIQACTEMLAITTAPDGAFFLLWYQNMPPQHEEFPFLKLPRDIRRMVYDEYLKNNISKADSILVAYPKRGGCQCSGLGAQPDAHLSRINTALAQTCRLLSAEFLEQLYRRYTVHYTCTCDMHQSLRANTVLRENVRRIKVHWNGPESDMAFRLVRRCSRLKILHLVISKATTNHLTRREERMQQYFRPQKPARICDALGMDELLRIRGLDTVFVSNITTRQGFRRSDDERANLHHLLNTQLVTHNIASSDSQ